MAVIKLKAKDQTTIDQIVSQEKPKARVFKSAKEASRYLKKL